MKKRERKEEPAKKNMRMDVNKSQFRVANLNTIRRALVPLLLNVEHASMRTQDNIELNVAQVLSR